MRTFKSEFDRLGILQTRRREIVQKSSKTSDKPKERLTDRDFAELMGVHRPTYGRVKGRVKQR